jgi:putative FmdB family regulatory protein
MPTYEYSCKSCGEHLEVVQSFKDEALTECPNCGGDLRKVFGSIGIVFKGSGFYRNDSRQGHSSVKPATTGSATSSEPAATPSAGESVKASADGGSAEKATAPAAAPSSPAKGESKASKAAAAS